MKLQKRHVICICMICLTGLLSLAVLAFLPDTIQLGSSVQNGVKTVNTGSKYQVLILVFGEIVLSIFWDFLARANQKRIDREPELKSYRIYGALISFLGFLYIVLCAVIAAATLITNL